MKVQSSPHAVFYPGASSPFPPLWEVETLTWSETWVQSILASLQDRGGWVVDPFARHPAFVSRALAADRRPIAANLDACQLLTLWLLLAPPEPRQLDAAFTTLADTHRDDTTLAQYLAQLYRTICRSCQTPVSADYFVWDSEKERPVEVAYRCGQCGAHASAAITQADLDLLGTIETRGARYWQLMRRLVEPNDELSPRAEGLIPIYTPRNRQVLLELVLQIESLFDDTATQRALKGLVLSCLERCHSLQTDVNANLPFKPTRLRPPRRYIEWNVWHLFEGGYRSLRNRPPSPWQVEPHLLSADWDEAKVGATIRQMPARSLIHAFPPGSVDLIVTEVPRPESAVHGLSFLWTGWLWGREATRPLRSLAAWRGLDWSRYSNALAATFHTLHPALHRQSLVVLSFTTVHEEMFPAVVLAAERADLVLSEAVAGDVAGATTHLLTFTTRQRPSVPQPSVAATAEGKRQAALDAAATMLRARGQPSPAATLARAILQRWSQDAIVAPLPEPNPEDLVNEALDLLPNLDAIVAIGSPASGETPTDQQKRALGWWLAQRTDISPPLVDRVEEELLTLLQSRAVWHRDSLWATMYERFPGPLTPDSTLLDTCLRSYAAPVDEGWQVRPEDAAHARGEEQEGLIQAAISIGRRLGYDITTVQDEMSPWWPCRVLWLDGETPSCGIALQPTAQLQPWLGSPAPLLADLTRLVVIPASRAGLVAYKLKEVPGWSAEFNRGGWQFVKNRHLRRLADVADLDRGGFAARLHLDPIVEQVGEQLPLFT